MKVFKTMTILIASILFLTVTLTYAVPGHVATKPADREKRIIIYHVNDLHARIDQFSAIAWQVQQEKKNHPDATVLFMNAGDNFSGNPVVDQAEPAGEPVRLLLKMMDIDVMTLGNHEFDTGQPFLKTFIETVGFPVLGANIKIKNSPVPQPKPYVILTTKNNIKIAVLGLIQVEESGIPSTHPDKLKGIEFTEPLATAQTYKHLDKECDIFIALTHLGLDTDEPLADEMGELDVIVGGHSHTQIDNPKERNGVLIVQTGGNANFLGRIELILANGKVIKKSGELIKISTIKGSIQEMDQMIAKFNDNPALKKVIGKLCKTLYGKFELGNLTGDAICKQFKLDMFFQNAGGIRIQQLGPDVHVKDVYALHPFGNTVVKYNMTGEEVRGFIVYDFSKHRAIDAKVSGLCYEVTHDLDNHIKKIDIRDKNGQPLDDKRHYVVGMNDYMASSYAFTHQDPGQSLLVTVADALADYIRNEKGIGKDIENIRTWQILTPNEGLTELGKTLVEVSSGERPLVGSSVAGNLVTDAMRAATSADVAFYPTILIRMGVKIPAGSQVFLEYLRELYPYAKENLCITGEMTGKDVKAFLLEQLLEFQFSTLQVSGVYYSTQLDNNGKVIALEVMLPDGKPLEEAVIYRVAFNQYEFEKHYKLEGKIQSTVKSQTSIWQILADFIRQKGTIGKEMSENRIKGVARVEK